MGQSIDRSEFEDSDYKAFEEKLHRNLRALHKLLERKEFGEGATSLGAELEIYLIDDQSQPLLCNTEIQAELNDPNLTLELNRYNLEYNFTPVLAAGKPFSAMEAEMVSALSRLDELAANRGGHVLPIGILPTLTESNFGLPSMTDTPRYHVLIEMLKKVHKPSVSSFGLDIQGQDHLQLDMADSTMEGACTSFQVHYKVHPDEFANAWNAVQLVSPIVLGLAANSPFMLGKRLWHETRVPLFQQSIEGVPNMDLEWRLPARVCFGLGWVRHGAAELFEQMARLYPPLMPNCSDEDPIDVEEEGGLPGLHELCLHTSTVWSWNRAIYGAQGNGHVRIEMRSLPAGPTPIDMMANAAFAIGLAAGMRNQVDRMATLLPFQYAEFNFYKAARDGINANILWPSTSRIGLNEHSVLDLAELLLPTAEAGLARIGVDYDEASRLLGVIARRIESLRNGASWQLLQYNRLRKTCGHEESLRLLVEHYRQYSASNTPVSEWDLA